ncbi:hypothetical protein H2200_008140 [Cladophialophora chaetospira]|uniref:Uncharacterized protein n=1 Tax=Cladophialophora chaetospira TaxID=386627 RepID=A0AA38X575_9EURO|nr:hypothetical protein H2200_008140 [Cladophialophora chaetospira]
MAGQPPFDPGGPSSLFGRNAEAEKPEPSLSQPYDESVHNGEWFQANDTNRDRANNNTHQFASGQLFQHVQYGQVPSRPRNLVGPPFPVSYGLQTAPYSPQAYNRYPAPPNTARSNGSFGIEEEPPSKRRRSLPPPYNPNANMTSAYAPLALQGNFSNLPGHFPPLPGHFPPLPGHFPGLQGHPPGLQGRSPVRGKSGHQDGSLLRRRSGAPQLRGLPAENRKENDPLQASLSQDLTNDRAQDVFSEPDILLVPSLQSPTAIGTIRAGPQAQKALTTSKSPSLKIPPTPTANAGPRNPPSTLSARRPPQPLDEQEQTKTIVRLGKPNAVIRESVREVFNDQQCDLILWLALHSIPSAAIAHSLTIASDPVRHTGVRLNKKDFEAVLSRVVPYFIPELAAPQNGEKSPEDLVRRLLDRGDLLGWSPFFLRKAIDYTFIPNNDDTSADQERKKNAKERVAALRFKAGGENSRKQMLGMGGVMREASEQEIMEEEFGYREGSHEVEEVLMKNWLLKIRGLGRLPDRSEVGQVQMEDDALETIAAT